MEFQATDKVVKSSNFNGRAKNILVSSFSGKKMKKQYKLKEKLQENIETNKILTLENIETNKTKVSLYLVVWFFL